MPQNLTKRKRRKDDRSMQKTRKVCKKYMNDDDEFDIYYPMDDICKYLHEGGGSGYGSFTRTRIHTRHLLTEFVRRGWRPDYVTTTFGQLHDRLIREYEPREFIEKYAETAVRRLGLESYDAVADVLIQIGLRADVSRHLEHIVEPLHGNSYSDLQIIDTAIAYLLGHYTPMMPPTTTHPIEAAVTDVWMNYTHESKTISIYNMSRACSNAALPQFNTALESLPRSSDSTFYFHSTSWRGSLSIMEGVSRLVGRRCLDFGIFPGFYMSPTPQDATGWGYANHRVWADEVAIMIFCIPNIYPSHLNYKELVGSDWVQVTSHSRLCRDSTDIRSIRRTDILYGDMVKNASAVRSGAEPVTHTPPKKQLVSKSDAGDSFIHECLVGCIYFQKSLL